MRAALARPPPLHRDARTSRSIGSSSGSRRRAAGSRSSSSSPATTTTPSASSTRASTSSGRSRRAPSSASRAGFRYTPDHLLRDLPVPAPHRRPARGIAGGRRRLVELRDGWLNPPGLDPPTSRSAPSPTSTTSAPPGCRRPRRPRRRRPRRLRLARRPPRRRPPRAPPRPQPGARQRMSRDRVVDASFSPVGQPGTRGRFAVLPGDGFQPTGMSRFPRAPAGEGDYWVRRSGTQRCGKAVL